MSIFDWEQDDAQDEETRRRDSSDLGITRPTRTSSSDSRYKYPLYLDPDRAQPATEERIEIMVKDGLCALEAYLANK